MLNRRMHSSKQLTELKNLGAELTEIDFSAFGKLVRQLYQGSWVAERTAAVADLLETSVQDFDPTVLEIIQKGQQYTAVDAYNAEYLKQELARDIQQTLAQFDALVVPSSPTIHTLAEMAEAPIENNSHFGTYTNFTNLADLSAIAVPAGFRADGLPFGITFIAPAWHDTALADFAEKWQKQLKLPLGAVAKTLPEQLQSFLHHPHSIFELRLSGTSHRHATQFPTDNTPSRACRNHNHFCRLRPLCTAGHSTAETRFSASGSGSKNYCRALGYSKSTLW